MKRVMITIALGAAMLATGAMAQTSSTDQSNNSTATQPEQGKHHFGRRHHGGMNMKKMAEKLNLSQQQQDQLKPIFEKQREQAKAIRQDNSLTQDQKKEKMQALHQDFQTQVSGILTPEQQQQVAQMKANGREHMRGKMGARMAEKLNLSQQQQDQLKPIFEKQHEQMRAIWQDNSLSKDQKKEKMQALRQDFQTQINDVLTPDQQQQWQQMREQMKHRRHHGEDQAPTQPQS
jgi:Spy/CpxP family protein refolding chaperone